MAHPGVLCFLTIICLSVRLSDSRGGYNNDLDGNLDFKCASETQAISSIYSVHHNKQEDRRFSIHCKDVPGVRGQRNCEYSNNWENSYDDPLIFQCRSNMYIVGMESQHHNQQEDRMWKFYCCGYKDFHLYDCEFTEWTNYYDEVQDFRVQEGKVIKGVTSVHDNHREDRLYKYNVCKIKRW